MALSEFFWIALWFGYTDLWNTATFVADVTEYDILLVQRLRPVIMLLPSPDKHKF